METVTSNQSGIYIGVLTLGNLRESYGRH